MAYRSNPRYRVVVLQIDETIEFFAIHDCLRNVNLAPSFATRDHAKAAANVMNVEA